MSKKKHQKTRNTNDNAGFEITSPDEQIESSQVSNTLSLID